MGAYDLDALAANNIIDFDAESYIKGRPPRYVGNPDGYVGLPFERPLPACNEYGVMPGPHIHGEPKHDSFVHSEHEGGTPDWKGFMFGALLTTLAAVGLYKHSDKIRSWLSKKIAPNSSVTPPKTSPTAPAPAPAAATNATPQAQTTDKKSFGQKIKDGFSKVKEKTSEAYKIGKEKFKAMPKWARIATASAAVLGGLYAVYKMFFSGGEGPRE